MASYPILGASPNRMRTVRRSWISFFTGVPPGARLCRELRVCAEAARRALAMTLQQLVSRYRIVAANFGDPVPLSAFGSSTEEIARVFSIFDEDYHISRFFYFTRQDGPSVCINGEPATHVALDPEIQSIL
jgi:hypothetical protein